MKIPTMLTDVGEWSGVTVDNYTLEFELGEPTEKTKEVALRELRETPENRQKGLEELNKLLDGEPNLKCPRDDLFLLRFLRTCKYYPDSAFKLIKNYYSFKLKHADVYKDLKPSNEKNVFDHNVIVVFPNRDQLGRRVAVLELGKNWKHKQVALDEVFKAAVLYLEAAMWEPETQINGVVVIFDMDGLSLQQTWQFTPAFAKRIVDWLQDSVPLRVKAIHVVNQPKIFNVVFSLFKPFLREKLRSRIYFHGTDRQSLYKHMSPECLPAVYGGTRKEPRFNGDQWYKLLVQAEKEYEAINTYGYKK
ncbi:alpha-tocopherol transfer protein-like isoform X1 [Musca domestica]|uniref:Alpha-tocopherol transfer protein-like isoform X1 n=2 Tax=Musca domestica TaxID=7370 RepID=A0A1I8MYX3_MUSDO|nr:alpha-tocopherol transfer protein-like isoform X1 [Musca domestica]